MPPRPPAVGVAKVTFGQAFAGRQFGDSLHFWHIDDSTWSAANLAALATQAGSSYDTTLLTLQTSAVTHVDTTAIDLSDTDGRQASVLSGAAGTGAGTHPLTTNTVAHIALEVPRRYRGGRPGYNVSGLDMTDLLDPKSFSNAFIASLVTQFTTLVADIVSLTYGAPVILVGVSYFLNNVERTTPLIQPTSIFEPQQRVCSLRRRSGKPITL